MREGQTDQSSGERWWRFSVNIPCWMEDVLVPFLIEQGTSGVEVREGDGICTLTVYLPQERPLAPLEVRLKEYIESVRLATGSEVECSWEVEEVQGENWKEAWKAHFHARMISPRLAVRPSWEKGIGFEGAIVLEIDPGQAFGTGSHETTRMCLEWIDELLGEDAAFSSWAIHRRGLDVGTGTGILAIAMAKLGMAEVWALDTDPLAVKAAKTNVLVNGVGDRVRVFEGSVEDLNGERFSLAVANLSCSELAKLAGRWDQCLDRSGFLIASGLLREEKSGLRDLYRESGLDCVGERQSGQWCSILLRPRS